MSIGQRPQASTHRTYAGLDFINAAFCPLAFKAVRLSEHPLYVDLQADKALKSLEVGGALNCPRQFRYKNASGNYKIGTPVITAPFGLAPKDFDLFLGLYTYLKQLPASPVDG